MYRSWKQIQLKYIIQSIPTVFEIINYLTFVRALCIKNRRYNFDVAKTLNTSGFYCVSIQFTNQIIPRYIEGIIELVTIYSSIIVDQQIIKK